MVVQNLKPGNSRIAPTITFSIMEYTVEGVKNAEF
jgi:hypothetical protein